MFGSHNFRYSLCFDWCRHTRRFPTLFPKSSLWSNKWVYSRLKGFHGWFGCRLLSICGLGSLSGRNANWDYRRQWSRRLGIPVTTQLFIGRLCRNSCLRIRQEMESLFLLNIFLLCRICLDGKGTLFSYTGHLLKRLNRRLCLDNHHCMCYLMYITIIPVRTNPKCWDYLFLRSVTDFQRLRPFQKPNMLRIHLDFWLWWQPFFLASQEMLEMRQRFLLI